ncbi:MAG: YbjQ family protein [Syntrophus sp. (in: bacteria)]
MPGAKVTCTTSFTIEGWEIMDYLGMVRGIVVRSLSISQGLMGAVSSILGGSIQAYTEMCEKTRSDAYSDMLRHAQMSGANAVIGVRYDSAAITGRDGGAATEVLCYGTAVMIKKVQQPSVSSHGNQSESGMLSERPIEGKDNYRGELVNSSPVDRVAPVRENIGKWELPR